jgi:hypothetical protein
VVEYNTSTNPTFEGAVRDTSGRGFDGVFAGGASYDATQKALDIAGIPNGASAPSTSAYLEVGQRLPFKGNQAHTVSLWFNKQTSSHNQNLFGMWKEGTNYATTGHHSGVLLLSTGKLQFWHYGGDLIYTDPLGDTSGGLRHLVTVYTGTTVGDQKLYVNGIEAVLSSSSGLTSTLDITNAKMTVGQDYFRGNYYYQADTEFSGIKVYDTALTAEEAKTLYDMGRCDEGHHVVNFSKTRVGIGLGDGEAPRGVLDVRGDLYLSGNIIRNTSSAKSGGVWLPTYQFEVGGSTFVEDQRHGYYHIINNVLTAVYRARVVSNSGAGTIRPSLPGGHKVAGVVSGSTVVTGWWARNGDFAVSVGPYLISDTTNGYAILFHPGQTNAQVRLDGSSLEANQYWTMFLSYPVE